MLWESLDGNIQLEEKIENWEESIRIASKPLLEKNVIEERYIKAMIENIKKLGFFVVLREYLAMPHARPEEGAVDTGISFLKLNSPVKYGDDDIYLIFVLASKDAESHTEILMELANLFQDDETIEKLVKSRKLEEIEEVIKNYK
mgnify:FL=1